MGLLNTCYTALALQERQRILHRLVASVNNIVEDQTGAINRAVGQQFERLVYPRDQESADWLNQTQSTKPSTSHVIADYAEQWLKPSMDRWLPKPHVEMFLTEHQERFRNFELVVDSRDLTKPARYSVLGAYVQTKFNIAHCSWAMLVEKIFRAEKICEQLLPVDFYHHKVALIGKLIAYANLLNDQDKISEATLMMMNHYVRSEGEMRWHIMGELAPIGLAPSSYLSSDRDLFQQDIDIKINQFIAGMNDAV